MSKEAKTQEGWETEESGGFIKFDEVMSGFTGLVIGHTAKNTPKGVAQEYKVITKNGTQSFYAPKDLHDKLAGVMIKYGVGNAIVKVEFKEKIKTLSGNDFKIFEVQSRKKDEATLKELGINPDPDAF